MDLQKALNSLGTYCSLEIVNPLQYSLISSQHDDVLDHSTRTLNQFHNLHSGDSSKISDMQEPDTKECNQSLIIYIMTAGDKLAARPGLTQARL